MVLRICLFPPDGQNGYDHHAYGNFNKGKYNENKKFYVAFNVKEEYEDDYSHCDNRKEDMDKKLGVKVNPKGRKASQDFDYLRYSSYIHYSDHEQVHSNKAMWSVVR